MGRNIIFLDFDGVLHPILSEFKKKKDPGLKDLRKLLGEQYHDAAYEKINESVLHYVYYGFSGEACYCVKKLCCIPHTEIVLSTSWRTLYDLDTMRKLLDLHKIGRYVSDITPILGENRTKEIQTYLEAHQDIDRYLIIDDLDLSQDFPGHMLLCTDRLHLYQYRKGYEILTN